MAVIKQQRLPVSCPACGHRQLEPAGAVSTNCRRCGQHIRVQEVLHPTAEPARLDSKRRRVTCFECGVEQEVVAAAQSTMCSRCSRYIDLADYRISSAVSKNFRTKGCFVVEPKGYVFNTEALVGEAVLRGRFLGRLTVEGALRLYSSARVTGMIQAGKLIVPAETAFSWNERWQVGSAEIEGELVGKLNVSASVILKHTARFFGEISARTLLMEEGAVFVGAARALAGAGQSAGAAGKIA